MRSPSKYSRTGESSEIFIQLSVLLIEIFSILLLPSIKNISDIHAILLSYDYELMKCFLLPVHQTANWA